MDNLCHSLAGAAIAQAGFAKRFPHATLLCVIGANIPDVDASAYLWGDSLTALQFRRGWTHGLPALAGWTLLLAVIFWWWQRRGARTAPGVVVAPLATILLAAFLSVFSHTSLDWLNNYGVRWLMPMSEQWFAGDTLFIVDPALLLLFGGGWWLSRRRLKAGHGQPQRPARWALAAALLYVVAMKGMSEATRASVVRSLALGDATPRQLMVAPHPISVLRRDVLVRTDSSYEWYVATFAGLSPRIGARTSQVLINDRDARSVAAASSHTGRAFLRWSRFPYFVPGADGDSASVFIGDVRYTKGTLDSWAAVRVTVE